jgi:pyruvate formate lyase activating enzyme
MKEAMFWEKKEPPVVQCSLCFHRCTIGDGKRGICGVRENRDGTLYSLVYGKSISQAIDPIEKKPLFHFMPGTNIFSVATVGCNFKCLHCQNFNISQAGSSGEIYGEDLPPERIVSLTKQSQCDSIAYTYTEPTIYFEYALDTAKLANLEGINNIFVTNGYITPEALRTIKPYLDGANIDLKSLSDDFYKKICGARVQPVLDSIRLYRELGIWIEITTLVIPTYNDSEEEMRGIARFILELGPDVPWHISQYYPTYKLNDQPRTPIETLVRAREIGLDMGLRYVYLGNVPAGEGENTYCYRCGGLLIGRTGYHITEYNVKGGKCGSCGARTDGVFVV